MCCKQSCLSVLVEISLCLCMVCACMRVYVRASVRVCVHACVCAEVIEVYDTVSCLSIVNDRAATEGSKYFELGSFLVHTARNA